MIGSSHEGLERFPQSSPDERFMRLALEQARCAFEANEVPVGAVIVHNGRVIAAACNQREMLKDPTAHAEIIAITQAAQTLQSWRLEGCTLYCTLEPCPMCAGAILQARMERLIFGAVDAKAGAVKSLFKLLNDARLNHRVEWQEGLLAAESTHLLQQFFGKKRGEQR